MASIISMKALLECGVHFGHRTNKWNPLMKPYIFTERNGIHIIDLQQTVKSLNTAYNYVRDLVQEGGTVLFVGTKRQAQETVLEEAERCGMPYVTERWLGGTITNWVTIQQRIRELEKLERMQETGEINALTKKERLMIEREINRLLLRLSGIRKMTNTPDMLFIVDVSVEDTAIHEANLKDIPVVAMVDTNCDPRNVDYVIPSNDDAIRAIKLIVAKIADAVLEGRALRKDSALEDDFVQPEGAEGKETYQEEEISDEELLGESTLAKLSNIRSEDETEESGETEEAAKTEETAAEETETVEEATEEVTEEAEEKPADAADEEEGE